jgi:hypothetical protein
LRVRLNPEGLEGTKTSVPLLYFMSRHSRSRPPRGLRAQRRQDRVTLARELSASGAAKGRAHRFGRSAAGRVSVIGRAPGALPKSAP